MRRISGLATITTFFVLLAMLLSACGSSSTSSGGGTTPTSATTAKVTVGMVSDTGGLNDGGFNQFTHLGYEKARAQYGFPDVIIQSQVVSDTEYIKNLTAAAKQADMVIAVGFLMEVAVYKVATQFPNKKFAEIDGCAAKTLGGDCVNLPNVAPLFFKEQQAGCLAGAIAGQMEVDGKSKAPKLLGHNTISAVGGRAIPPVIRYIAGYKYCAQKVDPSVNFVVGYSLDFNDPTKCAAIANKQISDNNADIVFQVAGGCGLGALDAASQKNVYSIGVDVDQSKTTKGTMRPSVITSAIKRIDTAAYDIINLAETGGYANYVANYATKPFDINNDGVGYATPSSDVPQDAIAKANDFANQMKAGTLVVPTAIP